MLARRILYLLGCPILAACTPPPVAPSPVAPAPMAVAWTAVTLPVPPGPPGRIAVRDAVDCIGRWFVVGAVFAAGGATRPAAWDSTDGRSWRSLVFAARPTSLYGPQNVIYSVGCSGHRIVMIGSRSGGAHGNPRVSTWYQRADGVLAEADASFETYGGERAVNVAHVAGGPAGFLIAGNRTTGAAAWLSPDGSAFRLIEDAAGLASAAGNTTWARDAAATADGRWVLVGGIGRTGAVEQDPAAWSSADGNRWTPADVPVERGTNDLQRVARLGDDLVAVGLRGDTFGAWRGRDGGWQPVGRFGTTAGAVAHALSVTAAGGRLLAGVDADNALGVWLSADGGARWRPVGLPVPPQTGTDHALAVAGRGDTVLLAADDGSHGTVWTATL
jgi:hypothetical protein